MMNVNVVTAEPSPSSPFGCAWTPRAMPALLDPTDIVARVHKTTICGTDLHILGRNVARARPGLGLGHEGIVDILQVGSAVKKFKIGDRVLCCCISSCGSCSMCKKGRMGNCTSKDGNWSLGHLIDGMQAEFVRVPHADHSCYLLPTSCRRDSQEEDKYLMLADIIPTAYEIGLVDGQMADNKTVCIVGAGPVGLAAVLAAAGMYKPKRLIVIDLLEDRLALARSMGATDTILLDNMTDPQEIGDKARAAILAMVGEDEVGVDLVVEAVGLPSSWYVTQAIVKAGGNLAVLGVHGNPVTLNIETMWYRNFTMTAGMVHGWSIPSLMDKLEKGELDAGRLISHRMKLSEIESAYKLFSSRGDGVLKILLENDGPSKFVLRAAL